MKPSLRRLLGLSRRFLWLLAILSIPVGFFGHHDQGAFWWHGIPVLDALAGAGGALVLMWVVRCVASFAAKKEDFYD